MITITDSAKQYLDSVRGDDYVTLSVKGGGCAGMQYVWGFSKHYPDVEWSSPIDDCLLVDPLAELYILGSEIDYVNELGGSFLKVNNPSSTSSCGCGESFGV